MTKMNNERRQMTITTMKNDMELLLENQICFSLL